MSAAARYGCEGAWVIVWGCEVGVGDVVLCECVVWVWSVWVAVCYVMHIFFSANVQYRQHTTVHTATLTVINIYTHIVSFLHVGPYLLNPHEGLHHPLPAAAAATVWGWYAYHHYMQDRFDDNVSKRLGLELMQSVHHLVTGMWLYKTCLYPSID